MTGCRIVGGRVLTAAGIEAGGVLTIADGRIAAGGSAPDWDVGGLLVLPGIVDLHGDAFERQVMPRPGVRFPLPLALHDTDRQLVANGITTAYHGVTWSWEPGLRGRETTVPLVDAIEAARGRLACDTRVHLRWETFNLDAEAEIAEWIERGRIDLLAFNDHTPGIRRVADQPQKLAKFSDRAGLAPAAFCALAEAVWARADEVPGAIARLAGHARAKGLPLASHDDESPARRQSFHALGCRLAEFPITEETARVARDAADSVIMGAPNVVRGGSHINFIGAAAMVQAGLCDVLASDYYYPAPLHAAFRLVRDGVAELPEAWALISANPARAAGLADRGRLEPGARADVILVDDSDPAAPQVVATLVAGRPVYRAEAAALRGAAV